MGKTRAYTPTPEDIGSILKYEVVGYDAATYSESGKAFTVQTARVRSLPEPPRRALIPVVPDKPASGTFTVLTYNVLADLYATVCDEHQVPACRGIVCNKLTIAAAHAIHMCHANMPYTRAIHTCHTHMPYTARAVYLCSTVGAVMVV